jgi:hypothetical protein
MRIDGVDGSLEQCAVAAHGTAMARRNGGLAVMLGSGAREIQELFKWPAWVGGWRWERPCHNRVHAVVA